MAQVDMISLGTYLKRFNFKLHAKQVKEQKDNNFVEKPMNHMRRKCEFMNKFREVVNKKNRYFTVRP